MESGHFDTIDVGTEEECKRKLWYLIGTQEKALYKFES